MKVSGMLFGYKKSAVHLIFCLSLLFVISCSSPKETVKAPSVQKVTGTKYVPPLRVINSLYIEGDINVDLNGTTNSAGFKLSIASEDSLMIVITGPFGISVGRAFATPEKFVFSNSLTGDIFTGTPSRENMEQAMDLPLSFNDIVKLIKAETAEKSEEYVHYKVSEENAFERRNSKTNFERIIISPSDSLLLSFTRLDSKHDVALDVEYSNYESFNGILLAKKMVFNFPTKNSMVAFKLDEVEINKAFEKPFSFSVSPKAKVINLDK
jgi:hypothetical protein